KGRVLAMEIMLNIDSIANLIRKAKAFQIPSIIATSSELGMQSMDQELMRLLKLGLIEPEEAYMKANSKKEFELFAAELAAGRPSAAASAVSTSDLPSPSARPSRASASSLPVAAKPAVPAQP